MKNIGSLVKYLSGIVLICSLALFQGCKDDDIHANNYIEISDNSYNFPADGGEYTISVHPVPSGEWASDIQGGGDWLKHNVSTNTITLTAQPNTGADAAVRTAKIIITSRNATAQVTITQDAELIGTVLDENGVAPRMVKIPADDFTPVIISRNGRYVGGVRSFIDASDSYNYIAVIFDAAAPGKRFEFPAVKYNALIPKGISDDGVMLVDSWSDQYTAYVCDMEQGMKLITESEFQNIQFSDISADGKVWIGYGLEQGVYGKALPLKWVDGVVQALSTPEVAANGAEPTSGWQARIVSGDGKVIIGSDWTAETAVYWDAGGEYHVIAEELLEMGTEILFPGEEWEFHVDRMKTIYQSATNYNLSPNGKYYTTYYYDFDLDDFIESEEDKYPIIVDMESGEAEVLWDFPNHTAITASNEGAVVIATPVRGNTTSYVLDAGASSAIPSSQYIMNRYGIRVAEDAIIERFASGGKTLFGRVVVGEDSNGGIVSDFFYIYYPSIDKQ